MHPPTERTGLIQGQTGYLLVKVGGFVGGRFEEALAPLGLKARHVRVLEALRDEVRSQRELGLRTGMDRTTMVAVVDELENLGHVRRERSRTDRRKQVIIATERGTAVFAEALTRLARAQEEFLAPLSEDERRQLHDLMTRLFRPELSACGPEPGSGQAEEPSA